MKTKSIVRPVLLAFALLAAAQASLAGTVAISPSPKTVTAGETFSLQVLGKGFSETVIGGGFNLLFDVAMLQLNSVSIAPGWEFAPSGGLIDPASGTLSNASFNSFVAPKSGDFDVATLNFKSLAPGHTIISLLESPTFVFSDDAGNTFHPTLVSGEINAVPLPNTILLMLSGLLPFLLRRQPR